MSALTPNQLIAAIDDTFQATIELGRSFDESVANRSTDCPGWSVQDQFAHMAGLEQVLGGAPEPDIELPPLPHVDSDIDVYMEKHVHVRRQLPLSAVVDELAGLAPRRIAQLTELAAAGDPDVKAPFGTRPLSAALPVRVFDLWAHEQDIRRAVDHAPRVQCMAAEIALDRTLTGWSAGLPKNIDGLDADVRVEVTGPQARDHVIVVGDGGPTITLTGDLGDLTRYFCGRAPAPASAFEGDGAAAAAVAEHLALTP